MKTLIGLLILAALLLFASAATASNSATYTLAPEVLASGGQAASSANYSFVSTLGQPLIGSNSSATYSTCSGFWCEIPAQYTVMLPLVLKNF
jgi:hypothetical protein